MTVHWHDDEVGWCPCDEPPQETHEHDWRQVNSVDGVIWVEQCEVCGMIRGLDPDPEVS